MVWWSYRRGSSSSPSHHYYDYHNHYDEESLKERMIFINLLLLLLKCLLYFWVVKWLLKPLLKTSRRLSHRTFKAVESQWGYEMMMICVLFNGQSFDRPLNTFFSRDHLLRIFKLLSRRSWRSFFMWSVTSWVFRGSRSPWHSYLIDLNDALLNCQELCDRLTLEVRKEWLIDR